MSMLWIRDTLPFATVAAAARFVPIPLMDDVVKGAAIRGAIARRLTTRGEDLPSSHLKPLYSTGSFFGALLQFPLKLLLYPIRKIIKVISAARGVPKDFMEVFLLMRCLEVALDRGVFDAVDTKRRRRKRAKIVRKAFNEAFDGTDLSLISAGLGEALEHSQALGEWAASAAASLFEGNDSSIEEREGADLEDDGETARMVEEALNQGDIAVVLKQFDDRFVAELNERV